MSFQLSHKTQVSIVAAICLLGLVIALKNVLGIPADVLSRDVVWFILVYSAFSILYPEPGTDKRISRIDRPLYWTVLIVLVTAAIIATYAI